MIQFLDPDYQSLPNCRVDMSLLQEFDVMIEMQEYMMSKEYGDYLLENDMQEFRDSLLEYWWD